jgi:hypothetical protein
MHRLLGLLFVGLICSATAASAAPKPHLQLFTTEKAARLRCPNDQIVWASTVTHTLYVPGDKHYGHTHGGFTCESIARAHGYRGPTSHA